MIDLNAMAAAIDHEDATLRINLDGSWPPE
jgi:hypothetical protein